MSGIFAIICLGPFCFQDLAKQVSSLHGGAEQSSAEPSQENFLRNILSADVSSLMAKLFGKNGKFPPDLKLVREILPSNTKFEHVGTLSPAAFQDGDASRADQDTLPAT